MPTASPELRERMGELFGDEVDDAGPIAFLRKKGYRLTHRYEWVPPDGIAGWGSMGQDERDCVCFLAEEWDFGGMVTRTGQS